MCPSNMPGGSTTWSSTLIMTSSSAFMVLLGGSREARLCLGSFRPNPVMSMKSTPASRGPQAPILYNIFISATVRGGSRRASALHHPHVHPGDGRRWLAAGRGGGEGGGEGQGGGAVTETACWGAR